MQLENFSKDNLLLSTAYGIEQRVGGLGVSQAKESSVNELYSIFEALGVLDKRKKKAEVLVEIAAQLTKLLIKLGVINRKLDRIFDKLDVIEEKIDQAPFRAASIDNAGARETISESFEHWSSQSATAEDLRDARNAKSRLARNTRILMAGRKMAYVYDVILSYIFELNLDLLLDTPKSTLVAATTKVITYLKEAIDPNIKGSIGFYHAVSHPIYVSLLAEESKLDREDFIRTTWVRKMENAWGFVECKYDVFHVILGSLQNRDLRWQSQLRNERECYAYNYPDGPILIEDAGNNRKVPTQVHVEQMLSRFISHATVV